MKIKSILPEIDAKILNFSFTLLNEIEQNIHTKIFYYENQATSFVKQQVSLYLDQLQLNGALKIVYKAEMMHFFKSKLTELFKKYTLFKCY
jgi:hypothetical protein